MDSVSLAIPQAPWPPSAKRRSRATPKAQANLGRLLHSGLDVALDRVEAYYWLKASAAQGEVTGRNLFAELQAGFTKEETEAGEQRLKDRPPPRPPAARQAGPGPPIPR